MQKYHYDFSQMEVNSYIQSKKDYDINSVFYT